MGLLRRLDDLDTRVIGRGNPHWNSHTPRPWTPEVGSLVRMRTGVIRRTWATGSAAVALLGYSLAVPSDESTWSVVTPFLLLTLFYALLTTWVSPSLDSALPVDSDADVAPVEARFTTWLSGLGLAAFLLATDIGIQVTDDRPSLLFPSLSLGFALGFGYRAVEMARREDEQGVEFLRARRPRKRRGTWGLYVRPRPSSHTEDR